MPLEDLPILPGLYTIQTDRGAKTRWKSGNKVRFHNGMPQKIGGWVKYSANTFSGICRLIFDWASLALVRYRAIGTHSKFYVETAGTFSDITPAGLPAGPQDSTDGGAQARTWSCDNWGEDLIINPRGGAVYLWDTSVGVGTAAAVIAAAPASCLSMFVTPVSQHLVMLGAHNGSYLDPLLIKWSDSQDYNTWTVGVGHTAGTKRLTTGNQIMCGIKTGSGEYGIFTDSNLWSMVYEGQDDFTFSFQNRGATRGLLGPNAAVEVDGKLYWMGNRDFMFYDGVIQTLPCDVHNIVYGDVKTPLINTVQGYKVHAHFNKLFREIWWYYPANGQTECTNYVVYNVDEKHWTWGTIVRTAGLGDSDIFDYVVAAGSDGFLYKHETGTDDVSSPIVPTLESYDFDIATGEKLMFCGRMVPDVKAISGTLYVSLKVRKYPGEAQITKGPYSITSSTGNLNVRARGRQMCISLTSTATGDDWRLGMFRMDLQPDGEK